MNTLADRLRRALSLIPGGTQAALAAACGVSTASVSDWFSGKTKTLKASSAKKAAAYLRCDRDWLESGKGPAPGNPAALTTPATWASDSRGFPATTLLTYAGPAEKQIRVDIVGILNAEAEAAPLHDEARPLGHVQSYSADPRAYALRVSGDDLHPVIRHGACLIVEPGERCMPGELVLLVTADGLATVRELVAERTDSVSLTHPRTMERRTVLRPQILRMHAITAVVAASKWRAD